MIADDRTMKVPTPEQVRIDLTEFWAHTLLVDGTRDEIQDRVEQMENAAKSIVDLPKFGRLFNRMCVASFVHMVCARETTKAEDKTALVSLNPEVWKEFIESLGVVRSNMLRCDHNAWIGESPNERKDEDLELLPQFDDTYLNLRGRFEMHQAASQFRDDLEEIIRNFPKKHEELLRRVEKAIDDFKGKIPGDSEELLYSVRKDLFKANNAENLKDLPQLLLSHLNSALNRCGEPYSYDTLQEQTRNLMWNWVQENLSIPTFVRLGYGSVSVVPNTCDDTTTVSSWGADEDKDETEARSKLVHQDSSAPLDVNILSNHDSLREASETYRYMAPDDDTSTTHPEEILDMVVEEITGKKENGRDCNYAQAAGFRDRDRDRDHQTEQKPSSDATANTPGTRNTNIDDGGNSENEDDVKEHAGSPPPQTKTNRPPRETRSRSVTKRARLAAWEAEAEDDDEAVPVLEKYEPPVTRGKARAAETKKGNKKRRVGKSDEFARPWTDEEKEAIKKGIREVGVSSWKKIRETNREALESRTWFQIKFQYREMLKRGEIEEKSR